MTKDSELNSVCGYITPDGSFYQCEYKGHFELLSKLNISEKSLVKITKMFQANFVILAYDMTNEQIDTLYKWCLKHDHDFPADECELRKMCEPRSI